ncbi:MAG TPA: 3-dehydroquinate synthase, partial [Acidobacteriota bacterium]|nr:3-dehydroquinate synthase [Acidobacteriota bacterium]
MKVVRVNLGLRSYDIQIGEGVLSSCGELFRDHKVGSRIFLIANTTVWDLYGQPFMECLTRGGFNVVQLLIPDGERFKNIHTVENIYTYLIAQRA